MAEGARLEIVCRGNSTVGSNPTLSANPPPPALRVEAAGCFWRQWGGEALGNEVSGSSSAREVEKFKYGEVPEWSNGAVSKTVDRSRGPWVRIPPSPPSTHPPTLRVEAPGSQPGVL